MRELTEKEKTIVEKLIERYHPSSGLVIGELLMGLYDIECISEYEPEYSTLDSQGINPLRGIAVTYYVKKDDNFRLDFYEAILLINYLVENRYVVLTPAPNPLEAYPPIGEINPLADIWDPKKEMLGRNSINIFEVSGIEMWSMLNSTFIVTNALIDYRKDFKTIEQRVSDKNIKHAKIAIYVAVVGIIISTIASICTLCSSNKAIELDDSQFNMIVNKILESKTENIPTRREF